MKGIKKPMLVTSTLQRYSLEVATFQCRTSPVIKSARDRTLKLLVTAKMIYGLTLIFLIGVFFFFRFISINTKMNGRYFKLAIHTLYTNVYEWRNDYE